ncbi:hypothetical protein BN14_06644 [Rhizoctonia solani AG-1 IB]|uniref:Glucose-methanol-choline oxidoreductase N-terminal domain-containing protein n=1 Tax=Thanatephorus cucumeris (strain AG1-IB / isolate 7/3/14) TaxID=1108050 RepID=M5C9S5_THACB|nr:hypothetical protein BN14_06644 [Rhizoctonia solani AG-1 IB]
MYGGPQQPAFVQTIKKTHNVSLCPDLNGGAPNCVAYTPLAIDWRRNDYRSSSAEAYLTPPGSNPAVATGVQFGRASGARHTAYARKEVILAAGAINTPALMQLSGIGDSLILSSLGISTVVNLPTVGKNLQERTMNSLGAKGNGFDWGGRGPSNVIAFPNLYQVFGSQGASVASQIQSNITRWADSQAANGASASALRKIFQVQADLITKQNAPIVELFYDTGYPSDLGINIWSLLPFSRGRVQIESTDPFQKPKVTVNYFSVDFDLRSQIAGARMARKILGTAPLSDLSTGEVIPGNSTVPDDGFGGSDADWARWIESGFSTVHHPVGSCAMMAQELGGCVNGRLKVYGTRNLRVVDASIMPTQVSAHPVSTLYGIAEKVADMIKSNV